MFLILIFRWVSPKAMILTDFTVDRATLQDLGFYYIVQKTLSTVTSDDRLNNRTIMEYLRRTVPKVFQNTLSLLSTACIQQFLDELVWRENQGLTSSDAFHNILRDLGTQAQVLIPFLSLNYYGDKFIFVLWGLTHFLLLFIIQLHFRN